MTRKEQEEFVNELAKRIAWEVTGEILNGKTPESWDGHELRCWLADRFEASAHMSEIRREPRRKRARDYRKHMLVNNL